MDPVVLFDFDGVVADSLDVFFEAFTGVCRELDYHRLESREAFLKLFEGNAIVGLCKAGFPLRRLKQLGRQFAPRIEEANRRIRPFEGMPELLGELAQRHPVYIITSNVSHSILAFLERHAISGVRGVLGADQETSKVKKIKQVIRRYPGRPAYYIGDTKGDMREARRAGAIPIAVAWGWHTVAKLREGRPAHIVESPAMLRAFFM